MTFHRFHRFPRPLCAAGSVWAFLAVVFSAVAGCHNDDNGPVSESQGSLSVTVTGLPAGQNAAVTVTGPGDFSQNATASTTLTDLATGTYTVAASAVSAGGLSYRPALTTQTVTVSEGTTATVAVTYTSSTLALKTQLVAQGLSSPVYLTALPNDSRLFVVEQPGRIRIIKNGALVATPFLDASSRIKSGGEQGLLSVAFDPAYTTNGRFYIYYTNLDGDITVDRQTVSANPDVANTDFQHVISVSHQAAANHNGGLLLFGPDGMLYMGTGDGGGGGDVPGNAQNTSVLLGKLLRLDVTNLPYTIPPGNPFVGKAGADEIWAYGLRNPWRYTFDGTGASAKLYIADVGQNLFEEVDVADASTAGVNYGWHTMEATHCYDPASGCNMTGLTQPVLEYDHGQGCSISGGYVYHGAAIPELDGYYFYSDYCGGWLRTFRYAGGIATDKFEWDIGDIGSVLSFGRDASGELYMLTDSGNIYRIVKQ